MSDRIVINMQQNARDCFVCGADATGLNLGIPVYEDDVLPNDWEGEWGGVPACSECYQKQQVLSRPLDACLLKSMSVELCGAFSLYG